VAASLLTLLVPHVHRLHDSCAGAQLPDHTQNSQWHRRLILGFPAENSPWHERPPETVTHISLMSYSLHPFEAITPGCLPVLFYTLFTTHMLCRAASQPAPVISVVTIVSQLTRPLNPSCSHAPEKGKINQNHHRALDADCSVFMNIYIPPGRRILPGLTASRPKVCC
jgi:hypothetical protein